MKPISKAILTILIITLLIFSVAVFMGWQKYKTKWEQQQTLDQGTCNVGYANNYAPVKINVNAEP